MPRGAVCGTCRRDMLNSDGCVFAPGKMTPREQWRYLTSLPSWADVDLPEPEGRCRDCGALPDGYHHTYCCVAMCTLHNSQRLMCCDHPPEPPLRSHDHDQH